MDKEQFNAVKEYLFQILDELRRLNYNLYKMAENDNLDHDLISYDKND